MENEYSHDIIKNKRIENAIRISAEMFLENGIDSVKMTDIADESGVGVATLYRYFGTKTGILIAAMTYMWGDLKVMFSGVFESDVFVSQTGIKQINDLMRMYIVLFTAHKDFMRLLAEFDVFIRREGVTKSELEEYDRSIINFYPVFENAYKTGLADGTVREIENFPMLYLTYAHSLMELSKKLVQGEITPSDNFSNAETELNLLIDTAVYYFRKE
ncbi:MAG: TetR/AcrR family transcriptional regulator [Ruminococcus sp.]|nr:TetR/AcrR family transcriptional regulator [Ruminococcus sp.]